jgi:hypothetical protein
VANVPAASASLTSTAPATPAVTPSANPTPAVRTTAAVGNYRPGGTSSYTGGSVAAPVEIAARPSPPSTIAPAAVPVTTPAVGSEPWAPPAPSATSTGTRTY